MVYEYNNFLEPLRAAKDLLSDLKEEQQLELRGGIETLEKALPLIKNRIEQAGYDEAIANIETGLNNIKIHMMVADVQSAKDATYSTLSLLHKLIEENIISAYEAADDILKKAREKRLELDVEANQAKGLSEMIAAMHDQAAETIIAISKMENDTAEIVSEKTGAALANSFRERKEQHRNRVYLWGAIFLLGLSGFGWGSYELSDLWDSIKLENPEPITLIVSLILRLGIIIPALWAVAVSSQKLSEALRLEEGYAHKEAFLTLFVGSRREINELVKDDADFDKKSYIKGLLKEVIDITSKDLDYIFKSKDTKKDESNEPLENSDSDDSDKVEK